MSDAFPYWTIATAMAVLALAFALPRLLAGRGSAPRGGPALKIGLIALAVALPLLGFGLRALSGDPATPNGVATAASANAEASGNVPVARDELARHLARNPRDGRAWVLLARIDFEADRYDEAAASYQRALAASSKVAADPGVWCEYADALGMAQGGSLDGKPAEWIERALALKADHPKALEMAGSAAYGRRDFAGAARYWQRLRGQLAEGSPAQQALDLAIERARRLARTSLHEAR